MTNSITSFISGWFIPPKIRQLLLGELKAPALSADEKQVLQANQKLSGKYKNKRCFILATGPSINTQPLEKLAGEYCMATSDFYRHESFSLLKPQFYCLAPIHPPFSGDDAHKRLEAIKNTGTDADFFVALNDIRSGVKIENYFEAEKIHYMACECWGEFSGGVNLCLSMPRATSVALMAIWAAMGMGFSEIYLLGCDHDTLWQWNGGHTPHQTQHFYKGGSIIGNESFDVDSALKAHLSLRQQYHETFKLANSSNVKLVNANPKSFIDIMPRMSLDECLKTSQAGPK